MTRWTFDSKQEGKDQGQYYPKYGHYTVVCNGGGLFRPYEEKANFFDCVKFNSLSAAERNMVARLFREPK